MATAEIHPDPGILRLLADRQIRYFCLTIVLLAFLSGAIRTAIPLIATGAGYTVTGVSWAQGMFSASWPIFGLIAGTMIDRSDKGDIIRRGVIVFVTVELGVLALFVAGALPPAHVFVYAVISGILVVSAEAFMLSIPPLILTGSRLATFYGIALFLDYGFSFFAGPIVASLVLAGGFEHFLVLVVATLLAIGLAAARGVPDLPCGNRAERVDGAYVLAGFRFLAGHPHLKALTTLTFFLSVTFGAFLTLFIFFVTDPDHLGLDDSAYGLMFSAYAAGAMLGAVGLRHLVGATGIRTAVIVDTIGTAALLVVPVLTRNPLIVWVSTFLAGVGLSLWFVSVTTFRQRLTPAAIMGRANSAFRVVGYAGMPVGSLMVGVIGGVASLEAAAVTIAVMLLAALAAMLPRLWSIDGFSDDTDARP